MTLLAIVYGRFLQNVHVCCTVLRQHIRGCQSREAQSLKLHAHYSSSILEQLMHCQNMM